MNYFSVKETAENWNVSTRRVVKLAKDGRIEGAVFISNRWLIPENAVKPQDNRKKTSSLPEEDDEYRFPLFYYSVTAEDYKYNNFSADEKRMLSALVHYERAELSECIDILEKLLPETDNQYTRITILYIMVYSYHDLCNFEKAVQSYHQLMLSISQAGHQEELSLIFREVQALFEGPKHYADSFSLDYTYSYSKEFLVYLINANLSSDVLSLMTENPRLNIEYHEASCQFLEHLQYDYSAMFCHAYLSTMYFFADNSEMMDYHYKAAFDISEKYHFYSSFLYLLAYHPNYEAIIKQYSSGENTERLIEIAENHNRAHKNFTRYLGLSTLYLDLSPENYRYISYSLKGYTIKEMAENENSSHYNVKKNLKILFDMFRVDNRKELVSKLLTEMVNYYHS